MLAMLGSYSISDYTKKAAVAMFLFFAFFVILLMLNLLIAIMGESSHGFSCRPVSFVVPWQVMTAIYRDMQTLTRQWLGDSYSMVKESELVEGLRARAKLIVEHERLFPWRQTYARYLHVAEAVAEDAAQVAWDGLGGRLKALRREVADVKVDMKVEQAEVKAGQAEVKALLEKIVAQNLQNVA
jgi:hypothetical protein